MLGSQTAVFHCSILSVQQRILAGVNDGEVPPVPIPNTTVKLTSAENTWMETSRENRSMPAQNPHFGGGFLFV